jgi:hypothetical protein
MPFLAGVWGLFFMLGRADGLRFGELLLERCPQRHRTRASVQVSVAVLRLMQADVAGARARLADGLRLSIQLCERAIEGWALFFQGLAATFGGVEDAGARLSRGHGTWTTSWVCESVRGAIAALGVGPRLPGHDR